MMHDKLLLLLVVSILSIETTALANSESNNVKILDGNSVDIIAYHICEPDAEVKNYQLARLETIDKLVDYFNMHPHQLYTCRDKYLIPLERLQYLVKKSNDNVCGKEKIDLIEKFHSDYVSKWPTDVEHQKRFRPKIIIKFFMNYAYAVADACKSNLINKLHSVKSDELRVMAEKSTEYEHLDKIIKDTFKVNGSGSSGDINGITLAWTFLQKARKNENSEHFYIPTPGNNYKRATYATSDADKVKKCQIECRQHLKPIYENTLLPVIRLIDMGYYLGDELFAKEYTKSSTLKRLIGTVLICEFVLPIRVVQDDSVKPTTMVILDKNRARFLKPEPEDEIVQFSNRGPRVSLEKLTNLPTVTQQDGQRIFESLKANIRKHERIYLRAFKIIGENIKKFFGKLFGSCFTSGPTNTNIYPEETMPLFNLLIA